MEFLGVGPLELLFIIVIIIVVVGPKDIQRTMRAIGRGLNALYKSEAWKAFNDVSRELRGLPERLVREAEIDELKKTAQEIDQAIATTTPNLSAWLKPADGKAQSNARPAQPAQGDAASAPAAPAEAQAEPKSEPEPEAEPERKIAPAEAAQPQAQPEAGGEGAAPNP